MPSLLSTTHSVCDLAYAGAVFYVGPAQLCDPAIGFSCRGLTLTVRAPNAAISDWLQTMLCPLFEGVPVSQENADASLEVRIDAAHFSELLDSSRDTGNRITCFTQDQDPAPLPEFSWLDGSRALFDARGRFFLVRRGPTAATLIVERDGRRPRVAMMRVLREFLTLHCLRLGDLHLHAAAVAAPDGVTLWTGPKGAGKTTLLLHALAQGNVSYVANDRVLVESGATESGETILRGVLTIIRLRAGTLSLFPRLATRMRDSRFQLQPPHDEADAARTDPPSMSAAQLCSLVGAPAVSSGRLARILILEPERQPHGYTLTRLSTEAAEARMRSVGLIAGGAVADYFCDTAISAQQIDTRIHRLVGAVPCFTLRLGEGAYDEPAVWAAISSAPAAAIS